MSAKSKKSKSVSKKGVPDPRTGKERIAAALKKIAPYAEKRRQEKELDRLRRKWRPAPGRSKVHRQRALRDWTIEMVDHALLEGCEKLQARAMGHLESWGLDSATLKTFEEMFGYKGKLQNGLASNMTTRLAVARRWVIDAVQMLEDHPDRRFYMATFIDDAIRTHEYDTEIRLSHFQKKVRNALAYAGIDDWLGCTEFQPYTNCRKGRGRDIAPHMHVLFWLDEPLDNDARRRLENTKRFTSLTNADCVVVTERTLKTPGQIAHWAYYIFKAPERGLNMMRSRKSPDKWITRDAFVEFSLAARVMEILSQITLKSLIHASGDGLRYRTRLVEKINERSTYKWCRWPLRPSDAAEIWAHQRELAGKTNRRPVRFLRD